MALSKEERLFSHNSLYSDGQVFIPMVYIKKQDNVGGKFFGLVPNLSLKFVMSSSFEDCKQQLKSYLVERIKSLKKNNVDIPAFPSTEEILKQYDDVFKIEYIRLVK